MVEMVESVFLSYAATLGSWKKYVLVFFPLDLKNDQKGREGASLGSP